MPARMSPAVLGKFASASSTHPAVPQLHPRVHGRMWGGRTGTNEGLVQSLAHVPLGSASQRAASDEARSLSKPGPWNSDPTLLSKLGWLPQCLQKIEENKEDLPVSMETIQNLKDQEFGISLSHTQPCLSSPPPPLLHPTLSQANPVVLHYSDETSAWRLRGFRIWGSL